MSRRHLPRSRPPARERHRTRKTALLFFIALLTIPSCRDAGELLARLRAGGPSLIWISLDTLRADHLGLYGYARDTSPFLDELGRRGLYFDWAVAPQNSTLPTHVTMFTGYHPVVHGVMHSQKNPGVRLDPSVRTLPELLKEAGFATRAWVDGGKMSRHYGFARGFDAYDDAPSPFPSKLAAALWAIDGLPPGRRFFFLIHTYEIHAPYEPPSPYDVLFVSPGTRDEAVRSRDLYDGSIRFVDDELRKFVGELEERDLLGSTTLVVTGDHGESFDEYGIPWIGHAGHNLHQNITRVPWIVLHPQAEQRGRVEPLVGLVDFPNTILALLGLRERLPGRGVDVLDPDRADRRDYVSWTGEAWSLYSEGYHLLRCDERPGPERNGLFHVAADPREETAIEDPERVRAFQERLSEARRELERQAESLQADLREFAPIPASVVRRLQALGYVPDVDERAPIEPVVR